MAAHTSLVLWDWNGTLLDDLQLCIDSLNWLLRTHGYPQQYTEAQYKEIFGFPIQDYYVRAGFDFAKHPYPELARCYMDHYTPASEGCPLAAPARQVLARLQARGLQQVVLSASPLPLLHQQVDRAGIGGFFDELLGLDDIYGKSKVDLGLDFLRREGFRPENALMVGDTVHDWEVARAMGVACVLCSAGHHSAQKLRATGAPVIGSLAELPALLGPSTV